MQTQTSTKTSPVELPITQRIETAQAMLAKLQSAADDADAEAKRWSTTFDREPTEQAALTKLVAERKAINAREAVATHERDALGALLEQERQQTRAALAAEANESVAGILRDFKAAEDQIASGVVAFDRAVSKLAGAHHTRMRAQEAGAYILPVLLRDIITTMNERFGALRAQNAQHTTNAVARFIDSSGDSNVRLEFTRPAGHVPSPLR
jgi:hypothetical protein